MKTRVIVLLAVAMVWCVGSSASWASLAARLQAAAAARQRSAAGAADRAAPVAAPGGATAAPGQLNVADWLDSAALRRAGANPRRSTEREAASAGAAADTVAPEGTPPAELPLLHAPLNVAGDEDELPELVDAAAQQDAPPADDQPAPAAAPTEPREAPPGAAEAEEEAQTAAAETDEATIDEAAQPPAAAAPPARPAKDLSPAMLRLRDKVRTCLSYYYQRPERVEERSPWGIMHSLISYGVDTELLAGNQRVNAIGWLCYNRPCRGITLMTVNDGQLAMKQNGPGYQGHDGQLLSMLALSGVPSTYPIRVDGHEFTVADLVAYEQRMCKPKSELTFQLIGIAHYCPSDATWQSATGVSWDIPRMIREELAQPIQGAACGGTHRLIGLSMAVKTRQKRGEPLDGQWLRAAKFTASYQVHALKLQNRDGSFSTQWLARRDDTGPPERRLQTTGHILEWLAFSLPEKDLTDPRIVKSVNYLATLLMQRDRQWEVGPRGHALRALALYNERVFGDKPGQRRELLARRPGK
ncbi:MAG: hypothetical protein MUF48_01925 [Pirellulaceae bacterium]|nr:hypothetical protein [Pirellulaceae bacterium]